MPNSILGNVTLGYQPVWNQWRKRSGIRLLMDADSGSCVNAQHLLEAIAKLWPDSVDRLLLSVGTPALLSDLLSNNPARGVGIEIQDTWLADRMLSVRLQAAKKQGIRLVWRGIPGQAPAADVQDWFFNVLRSLTPQEALHALRMSMHQRHVPASSGTPGAMHSPVVADSLYEGLASPALVEHALDAQGAAGVVGWPTEEVLHSYHFKQIQPAHHLAMALVQAIDADESMESIEHHMGNDPLLTYRFLGYVNSAGLGLHREIDNIREGLMAVGYTQLRAWLMEKMPHTSNDANLDPIRSSIVLRARIMQELAAAGAQENLRREVFMCGIFSQLDLLLDEPLTTVLHRLPVPERVSAAILKNTGPYAPWLAVAAALECGSTSVIREVCELHGMAAQDVNRAMLRALALN